MPLFIGKQPLNPTARTPNAKRAQKAMPCISSDVEGNFAQAELHTTLALFGSSFIPETHAAVISSAQDR